MWQMVHDDAWMTISGGGRFQRGLKGLSREFKKSFRGVSRHFQGFQRPPVGIRELQGLPVEFQKVSERFVAFQKNAVGLKGFLGLSVELQ